MAFTFVNAQDTTRDKIRIGVLRLEITGMSAEASSAINDSLCNMLSSLGFYKVYQHKDMEKALAQIKQEIPEHCRDPRCVTEIGSCLGLDRMIFGRLDKNKTAYGVNLTLLDVKSRMVVEKVSIQGAEGIAAEGLLKTAVSRLHGLETAETKKMPKYFGPEIHNEKRFYYASGLCVGLGLIWAAINGGLFDFHLSDRFDTLSLSNLSSSILQVPFFARPTSLGDGYVAGATDAYGVLYNPAGMAWVSGPEMATGYQYRFSMLNNFIASYVDKATREIGFGECVLYSGDIDNLQSELHFISAYSYKFNHPYLFPRPISVGVSVKLSTITSPESEDATASQKTFGGGLDFGMMTEFSDNIRFAAVLNDAPSIRKVNNTTTGVRYLEFDPMQLHLGGTYQAGYTTFLICQGQIPLYADQYWSFSGGIEQELFRVFKVRLGLKKQAYQETPWLITGGFGLEVNTESIAGKYFMVDGSYQYSTLDIFPSANVSFRIGF
jgi:hypothetical protein